MRNFPQAAREMSRRFGADDCHPKRVDGPAAAWPLHKTNPSQAAAMFELIEGKVQSAPRHSVAPVIASIATHALIGGTILVATVVLVTAPSPQTPTMRAFIVAAPLPLPPPPAPVAQAVNRAESKPAAAAKGVPTAIPLDVSTEVSDVEADDEEFVGAEGAVPGGMAGGVIGGLDDVPLPPPPLPPPPPPTTPLAPVRVGGVVKAPTLVHKVEPVYPAAATAAGIEGSVILEAIVDTEGRIESLRVLRSHGLLDRAATEAVQQWRYAPVLLDGRPVRFILTVVVTFRLDDRARR